VTLTQDQQLVNSERIVRHLYQTTAVMK